MKIKMDLFFEKPLERFFAKKHFRLFWGTQNILYLNHPRITLWVIQRPVCSESV
jgi:hypothetical protein